MQQWRLSFWPDPSDTGPVWMTVPEPASPPDEWRAWRAALPYDAFELLLPLQHRDHPGTAMTRAQMGEFWRRHGRTVTLLDEPVFPPPRHLTSGFAEVDAARARGQSHDGAERESEWRRLAEQLHVPMPVRRADVLELLVAAGLLLRDGSQYRLADEPPALGDVLALPAHEQSRQDAARAAGAQAGLAADLESVVLWSGGDAQGEVAELARRLRATAGRVQAAARYAIDRGHLVGEVGPSRWHLSTTAAPDPDVQDPSQATVEYRTGQDGAGDDVADDTYDAYVVLEGINPVGTAWSGAPEEQEPPLPVGPPPAYGVLVDGDLWLPSADDRSRKVPLEDDGFERALATPHGTLLSGLGRSVLVSDDGAVHELGGPGRYVVRLVVRPGGQEVAMAVEYGRRSDTFGLDVIDLRTLAVTSMPWNRTRQINHISWTDAGTVLFTAENDPDDATTDGLAHAWRPEPEQQPGTVQEEFWQLLDGGVRARRHAAGLMISWPSGTARNYPVDGGVTAAHTGAYLFGVRDIPPALVLWTLSEHDDGDPVVLDLPEGTETTGHGSGRPVWESADTLLLSIRPYQRADQVHAVRVDARTRQVEAVPVPRPAGYRGPVFVEPPAL